jgi:hypothetical protein
MDEDGVMEIIVRLVGLQPRLRRAVRDVAGAALVAMLVLAPGTFSTIVSKSVLHLSERVLADVLPIVTGQGYADEAGASSEGLGCRWTRPDGPTSHLGEAPAPPGARSAARNIKETKMARKIYWVQFLSQSWAVRHSQQTLSTHTLKDNAITAGVKVAKANQPSSLKICRTIEDERTYGDDPYPPKG